MESILTVNLTIDPWWTMMMPHLVYISPIISDLAHLARAPWYWCEWGRGVHVDGPVPTAGGLGCHHTQASLLQGGEELYQAPWHSSHYVTAVIIFWQEKWKLQNEILFQSDLPTLPPGQLVHSVLCHSHDGVDQLIVNWSLVLSWLVAR